MCYDIDRFLDQSLVENLICSICCNVICCPQVGEKFPRSVQEIKYGHKYCEICINESLKRYKECPECRRPLDFDKLQQLDIHVAALLKKFKVFCINKVMGCKHVDEFEKIERHESKCEYSFKICKNCSSTVPITEEHSEIECELLKTKKENKKLLEENVKLKAKISNLEDRIKNPEAYKIDDPKLLDLCTKTNDNYDEIKKMLDANVNVNMKENDGNTPLIYASSNGLIKVVSLLLEKGAYINEANDLGNTALIKAVKNKKTEVVKFLLENNANVNHQNNEESTALIEASKKGHYDIVRWLIEKNANINAQDNLGNTALIKASIHGHLNVVMYLIERRARVNLTENNGETALIKASFWSQFDVVKYLAENGASLNTKDNSGKTALSKGKSKTSATNLNYQHKNMRIFLIASDDRIKKYLKSKGAI